MRHSPIPTMYPEAKTPAQSHLFALADLAAKELDGVRVPGVSPTTCTPRHRAVGILEHLATQLREPELPKSLKDGLAEVFLDTTLYPRSDMDYLVSLRGLSLINPNGSQCLISHDLSTIVKTMLRETRVQDIELGIFLSPVHSVVSDFLTEYQKEAPAQTLAKIDSALRAYLDLWPTVPRSTPEAPLHPVFFALVQRDLAVIRQSASLTALKPPKGW